MCGRGKVFLYSVLILVLNHLQHLEHILKSEFSALFYGGRAVPHLKRASANITWSKLLHQFNESGDCLMGPLSPSCPCLIRTFVSGSSSARIFSLSSSLPLSLVCMLSWLSLLLCVCLSLLSVWMLLLVSSVFVWPVLFPGLHGEEVVWLRSYLFGQPMKLLNALLDPYSSHKFYNL